MKTSKRGIEFIKGHEKLRIVAYKPVPTDPWTIGWGHTSNAGFPNVIEGMKITEKEADAILLADVAKFEKQVNNLVEVPLNQSQFDALVSFHFNSGKLGSSTLLKLLNKGMYDRVPNELSKWVYSKKKKLNGLVKRRAEEAALFTSEDEVDNELSSDIRRATPPVFSKENVTWGIGGVVALGTPVAEVASVGQPIQIALAIIMVAAFAIAAIMFMKRRGS